MCQCGPEARCNDLHTWKQPDLTSIKHCTFADISITLPAVCHYFSTTVLSFLATPLSLPFSFPPLCPKPWFNLWFHKSHDLSCPASVLHWSWKLSFLLMRKISIWQHFPSLTLPFPFPFYMQLVWTPYWGPWDLFLTGISSATRKLLVGGMEVMNFSEKLQTKDYRRLQHTKYTCYFSCIAGCSHSWPVSRKQRWKLKLEDVRFYWEITTKANIKYT